VKIIHVPADKPCDEPITVKDIVMVDTPEGLAYRCQVCGWRLARLEPFDSPPIWLHDSPIPGRMIDMKLTMQQVKLFETLQELNTFTLSWHQSYGIDKRRGWSLAIDGVSLPDFYPTADEALAAAWEYLQENE
jgi:hypothetical protein